jgi:hypothetical protein
MYMRRYLLVLDMDLLAVDEKFDLEPISYLVAQQEREPCEVVVLSLVDMTQTKLPAMELLLGARVGKFPVAPRPDHDISAAAEHRMNLAVRHLKMIGCRASGLISDEDPVKAVRGETRRSDYDGVILATGRQDGSRLASVLGRDPVHRLRRRWGKRLIVFSPGPGAAELAPGDQRPGLDQRSCGPGRRAARQLRGRRGTCTPRRRRNTPAGWRNAMCPRRRCCAPTASGQPGRPRPG